jgi:hypothetical protein
MKPKLLTCMLSGLLLAPLPTSSIGGWAVISVQDLPDFAVPGRSFELVFTVRQHGVEPMGELEPTVDLWSGNSRNSVAATPTGKKGVYRATIEFPTPGDWNVTINSGFGPSRVTLVPITAVQAAGAPHLPESERGRAVRGQGVRRAIPTPMCRQRRAERGPPAGAIKELQAAPHRPSR